MTVLPSLRGWQPLGAANHGGPGRQSWQRSQAAAAPGFGRALSTFTDGVAITPAIEAQLERIQRRHGDVLQQLSGDAMLK